MIAIFVSISSLHWLVWEQAARSLLHPGLAYKMGTRSDRLLSLFVFTPDGFAAYFTARLAGFVLPVPKTCIPMDLLLVKNVHVACVAASYTLFFLRGLWLLRGSSIMHQRWVKIVPHVTDTLLLASAIVLAIGIRQYPGTDAWLTAKVAGLLLYIGLGMVAFRFSRTLSSRIAAWVAAQLVFFYIVAVALTRNPLPLLA